MQASKALLAVFVCLTMVFALISAWEFVGPGGQKSTVTVTQSVQTSTLVSGLKDSGYIQIGTVGYFNYTRVMFSGSAPTNQPIRLGGTTFTYVARNGTSTGCVCYTFKVTFHDNSSENLIANSYPTNFESVLVFSKHTGPIAGLFLVPSGGPLIYVLVTV